MRWLKYSAVGVLGIAVQLGTLDFLVRVLGVHYVAATALAVEAAILHNFAWHLGWTWADRVALVGKGWGLLLLRFNLTTGMVSIAGNLISMGVFAGVIQLDPIFASLLSICVCAILNFQVCDQLLFLPEASATDDGCMENR